MNGDLHSALMRERRDTFLAQAQADRDANDARVRRRSGQPATLRDGSRVLIGPIQRADAALLADGFSRLTTRSRRSRFLMPKARLSPAELRYFTDIDHHDHEALGAVNPVDRRGLGVARYIRYAEDPQAAEIAVTVIDDWQGRGLGTELLARLTGRARQEGVRRFVALVSAENRAVIRLLRSMDAESQRIRYELGTAEYEITLRSGGSAAPD